MVGGERAVRDPEIPHQLDSIARDEGQLYGSRAKVDNAPTDTTLKSWLAAHPDASITGRSQGGAIAMTLLAATRRDGAPMPGDPATFNSPGSAGLVLGSPTHGLREVTHFLSNGDIVSLVGSAYADGDVVFYDNDVPGCPSPNPVTYLPGSHPEHWAQEALVLEFNRPGYALEFKLEADDPSDDAPLANYRACDDRACGQGDARDIIVAEGRERGFQVLCALPDLTAGIIDLAGDGLHVGVVADDVFFGRKPQVRLAGVAVGPMR